MASAAQQQALSTPTQLDPGRPLEDYGVSRAPKQQSKLKLGFLKLDGLQHILRLRTRLQINNNLFADLGADCHVNSKAIYPKTALEYRVHKQDKHVLTLRADRRAVYLQKSFPVNVLDKVSARLQATAATSYQGIPEFVVGFEQIRPHWLIPVGAAVLLACGKSVTGSRTFAGTQIQLPVISHDSTAKGEVKASVSRSGNGLALALQQLNAILRF